MASPASPAVAPAAAAAVVIAATGDLHYVYVDGTRVPAVTASQMKELDRLAEVCGLQVAQMAENDGRLLADLTMCLLADCKQGPIVILTGKGGNGAGGLAGARHLANRVRPAGCDIIIVYATATVDQLEPACRQQRQVLLHTEAKEKTFDDVQKGPTPSIIIDALLGYNITGAPREPIASMIKWANGSGARIIAMDLPSGLDATTGAHPGTCINAAATLTLGLPKTGLIHAAALCGDIYLGEIGVPIAAFRSPSLLLSASVPYIPSATPLTRVYLPDRAPKSGGGGAAVAAAWNVTATIMNLGNETIHHFSLPSDATLATVTTHLRVELKTDLTGAGVTLHPAVASAAQQQAMIAATLDHTLAQIHRLTSTTATAAKRARTEDNDNDDDDDDEELPAFNSDVHVMLKLPRRGIVLGATVLLKIKPTK